MSSRNGLSQRLAAVQRRQVEIGARLECVATALRAPAGGPATDGVRPERTDFFACADLGLAAAELVIARETDRREAAAARGRNSLERIREQMRQATVESASAQNEMQLQERFADFDYRIMNPFTPSVMAAAVERTSAARARWRELQLACWEVGVREYEARDAASDALVRESEDAGRWAWTARRDFPGAPETDACVDRARRIVATARSLVGQTLKDLAEAARTMPAGTRIQWDSPPAPRSLLHRLFQRH